MQVQETIEEHINLISLISYFLHAGYISEEVYYLVASEILHKVVGIVDAI